jgi:crossover junction endodeoxyribonuclease RuvC
MILTFDLSLSCSGYSIFRDDGKFLKTGHIATNADEITPLRLKHISKCLNKLKKEYKPSKIVIEQGFSRHAKSTQQIFRVNGIVNLIFYNVEQVEMHATHVRKLVTGRGNINKDELNQYIQENYPNIRFENFDEVDSFALGVAYFKEKGVI